VCFLDEDGEECRGGVVKRWWDHHQGDGWYYRVSSTIQRDANGSAVLLADGEWLEEEDLWRAEGPNTSAQ
jgi:hypothetical protein